MPNLLKLKYFRDIKNGWLLKRSIQIKIQEMTKRFKRSDFRLVDRSGQGLYTIKYYDKSTMQKDDYENPNKQS